MTDDSAPPRPTSLTLDAARGLMQGSTERYERRLSDLAGLYQDVDAFEAARATDSGAPVYWVESSTVARGPGALTIGISTLLPGTIGEEFAMTRGHIHAQHEHAELYFGLSGRGVMLLETLDGESQALPVEPGTAVHVPGHWVHRSVNTGDEPFSTLFCYATEAGQDYSVIGDAGGMRNLVVRTPDGWTLRENPGHRGYRR
ncbi:MAG: glucose-6-phosphate isomerase, archaeal [Microbacteriaceae bacterium]|jgi:glucose-6-phosphate isomerase|nr:glucose-6-phosphate isomerase, archaeal [Microbacteriaceae bacterium]